MEPLPLERYLSCKPGGRAIYRRPLGKLADTKNRGARADPEIGRDSRDETRCASSQIGPCARGALKVTRVGT
jgi:hypothetical protein